MRVLEHYLFFCLVVTAAGCAMMDKKQLPSYQRPGNVPTTEDVSGVVSGQFSFEATSVQSMSAALSSRIGESSIEIPVGALAADLSIVFEEGAEIESLPTELGISESNTILYRSIPHFIETDSSTNLQAPMTLSIPLPSEEIAAAVEGQTLGLGLQANQGKVVMLFVMRNETDDGYKIGLSILGNDNLVGLIVKFAARNWGWFQIIGLSQSVEATEIEIDWRPQGKSSQ